MSAPLPDRLRALAESFYEYGHAANDAFIVAHASSLMEFARQAEEEYAPLGGDEVPTNAQGVKIARLMRDFKATSATVGYLYSLPEGFLSVLVSPRNGDAIHFGIEPNGDANS